MAAAPVAPEFLSVYAEAIAKSNANPNGAPLVAQFRELADSPVRGCCHYARCVWSANRRWCGLPARQMAAEELRDSWFLLAEQLQPVTEPSTSRVSVDTRVLLQGTK
jgi:hypothetical protein